MQRTKQELYQLIERLDGPALITYWDDGEAFSEYKQDTKQYDWHSHARGQFFCVESGLTPHTGPGCCRHIGPDGCRRASCTK